MILFLSILGLCVGSFLNVLVYRLNVDGSPKFWRGRSLCPKCRHQLSWADNIPVLSFFLLRGRCRYCHQPISWQYPVVELLTAAVTVAVWHNFILLLVAYFGLVIFFSDLIYGLIPDEAVAAVLVLSVLGNLSDLSHLIVPAATALISAAFFLLIFLLTKQKGLGFGDVKLAGAIGFFLGWPRSLVAFWSSFILGGLFAVALLILKKTKLSATIPLGPFLVLGAVVSFLWSNELLSVLVSSR